MMAELFQSYEARQRTGNGRRVAAWLAGSVTLHLLLVASVAYVPALQQAFQVATMFSGMEYGDEDYEQTNIAGEAITYVRAGDLFQYPAGYFSKNQPPAASSVAAQPTPTAIPAATPSPAPTPSPVATPPAEPTPVATPSPVASPVSGVETETTAQADEPEEPGVENVQDKLKQLPKINSRPFTDFFGRTKNLVDAGALDLSVPTQVSVEADRLPDGRLTNFRNWQFNPTSPQHVKIAREFVAMLSDSRAFAYLEGAQQIKLSGRMDASTVSARVTTPATSEEVAARRVGAYNLLLTGVRFARRGKNEEVFLKNTRINAAGRNIQIELRMPRSVASEVIAKQLPAR